jgi:hypothetical protein
VYRFARYFSGGTSTDTPRKTHLTNILRNNVLLAIKAFLIPEKWHIKLNIMQPEQVKTQYGAKNGMLL